MRGSSGSSTVEILVLGFLVALMLGQALVTTGRLQAAGERAVEVAQMAALEGARYGDERLAGDLVRRLLPGAAVRAERIGDRISVAVRLDVSLLGPSGQVSRPVIGRATARISPYRSNRG